MEMRRVVICEDHEIVYTGLRLLLEESVHYELAGHVKKGRELIPLLQKLRPDILILDLNLPDTDGFTLLRSIREFDNTLLVVILTMYQDEVLLDRAREEGANAYLLKNASNEDLLKALSIVSIGSFYVTAELDAELLKKKLFHDTFTQKMKLTRREVEIIRMLSKGKSSDEVAEELFISPHTVDTHRKNIFRKLEINNLAALVRFAYDHKIL